MEEATITIETAKDGQRDRYASASVLAQDLRSMVFRTQIPRPETRYAASGGVSIAYQVVGNGPLDLVYIRGGVSNLLE
jgi:hypothetical protein